MKKQLQAFVLFLFAATSILAQSQARVQVEKSKVFKPGSPVTFDLVLNEPLPKGARFDFRISPVATDEEVALGGGEPLDASGRRFRVEGTLPEGAVPGDWHVAVIWLFLPGTGWTHNTIASENVTFKVEGQPYALPTKAEVTVVH